MVLSEEQLNSLNKEALVIIVASLQDQLNSMQSQLDTANRQLADTSQQIELLTEQIWILYQRKFGRQSESNLTESQLSLFDSLNEAVRTADSTASELEISEGTIASYHRKKSAGKELLISTTCMPASLSTGFRMKNLPDSFLSDIKSFCPKSTIGFISSRRPLLWMSIMSMFMHQNPMTEQLLRLPVERICSGTALQSLR